MIGERLKELLEIKKVSVIQLAEHLNTTPQNIYKLFKKETIDTKYLIPISEYLEIPISQFFSLDDKTTRDFINAGRSDKNSLFDDEIFSIKDRLKKLKAEVILKNENIDFLKAQLDFYKHQSETLKFLNEQLIKSGKEGTPPTDQPG
jgi:transcriptional regulator with XRE-family HTH domain